RLALTRRPDLLPVPHISHVQLKLYAAPAPDLLERDLDMRAPEPRENHLARIGAALQPQAGVFLDDAVERSAHLVEVGFGLRRDRRAERRLRERNRLERDRVVARAEGFPGVGVRKLSDRADVAGCDLRRVLLVLADDVIEAADALVGVAIRIPDVGIRLERAGKHPEVG